MHQVCRQGEMRREMKKETRLQGRWAPVYGGARVGQQDGVGHGDHHDGVDEVLRHVLVARLLALKRPLLLCKPLHMPPCFAEQNPH